MELKLIKDEPTKIDTVENLQFEFFKTLIKKDLEVTGWCNNAIRVFGDFQIYSDHKFELNSFDQIISFLTGKRIVFLHESLEEYVSSQCSEYFMDILIRQEKKMNGADYELLSEKFTNYIIDASEVLMSKNLQVIEELKILDRKYFGASNLGTSNNRLLNH